MFSKKKGGSKFGKKLGGKAKLTGFLAQYAKKEEEIPKKVEVELQEAVVSEIVNEEEDTQPQSLDTKKIEGEEGKDSEVKSEEVQTIEKEEATTNEGEQPEEGIKEEKIEEKDQKTEENEEEVERVNGVSKQDIEDIQKLITKKNKTQSEKGFMRLQKRRLKERIDRKLEKTYREKIEDLNEHLSNLPVHFDIPRVGPG